MKNRIVSIVVLALLLASLDAIAQENRTRPAIPPGKRIVGICDVGYMKANAYFFRATTHCKKNYLDTPAGYIALAESKKCASILSEEGVERITKEGFTEAEDAFVKHGKKKGCKVAESLSVDLVNGKEIDPTAIVEDIPKGKE